METSAKTNVNIEKAFYEMAKKILDKQPEKKPLTTGNAGPTINPGGNNNDEDHKKNMNCCWSK
jgi:GTPase SAR1 family protein